MWILGEWVDERYGYAEYDQYDPFNPGEVEEE